MISNVLIKRREKQIGKPLLRCDHKTEKGHTCMVIGRASAFRRGQRVRIAAHPRGGADSDEQLGYGHGEPERLCVEGGGQEQNQQAADDQSVRDGNDEGGVRLQNRKWDLLLTRGKLAYYNRKHGWMRREESGYEVYVSDCG